MCSSDLFIKLIMVNEIGKDKQAISVYDLMRERLFGWAGILNSGLLFAIATVLLWLGVSYLMYRRRWFLKT